MKKLLINTVLIFTLIISFGQDSIPANLQILQNLSKMELGINSKRILSEEENKYLVEEDTTIRVAYMGKGREVAVQPAYYVNGIFAEN